MRIERIRMNNFTGLGNVDRTFPAGPVLLFIEDKYRQKMFNNLLPEILYDITDTAALKSLNRQGSAELWLAGERSRWQVSRYFSRPDEDAGCVQKLEIIDEKGQIVDLPEKMVPGEYLFKAGLRAYLQGGLVEWPANIEGESLSLLVSNLQQGGEEKLSPVKVLASLNGAQKRLEEQKDAILQLQTEYADLRSEWETIHRFQENERLLLIEKKKLQEKAKIIEEKIAAAVKIQERLALLAQNPDYRELRRLQADISRVEEQRMVMESNITELAGEGEIDRTALESLREDCLEWADIQTEEELLAREFQKREELIQEAKNFLHTTPYRGMGEDEVLRLSRAEEQRSAAQAELEKLAGIQTETARIQMVLAEETIRLEGFANLAGVTENEKNKIAQREEQLANWEKSRLGALVDKALQKRLSGKSIRNMLAGRLAKDYQNYRVGNYAEFRRRLLEYRDQQEKVESLRLAWERLKIKVKREEELRRIVHSSMKMLNQAFIRTKTQDFPAWLNGWEIYRQSKEQLTNWLNEQQTNREQLEQTAKKYENCAAQLREKLTKRGILAADNEAALAVVSRVAGFLREKDALERELDALTQKYQGELGERNMEELAQKLEPLADLERETYLSNQARLAELKTWQEELAETNRQLRTIGRRLQQRQNTVSLVDLEKKMEKIKRKIMTNEDLHRAMADARALWKSSWQEWQTTYSQVLTDEARRISSHVNAGNNSSNNYFAFRMAIAQLALGDKTGTPLVFSVGEMKEEPVFWEEAARYLQKLSLSRQVIFSTSEAGLWQVLTKIDGWQQAYF